MNNNPLKKQLYNCCVQQLQERLTQLETRFNDLDKALVQETKSSVGDKYETGRAMIHLERDKLQQQKVILLQQQQQLATINPTENTSTISIGSIIVTNQQKFYMSIGIGKLEVGDENYYALTAASPVGRLLLGKKVGEQFEFRGKKYQILEVF